MNNLTIKPIISISLKKPVIRIFKNTLSAIGNPEYILFLVNPKDCSLGILPSSKNDVKAHHISRFSKKKSIELYSKSLIRDLKNLCPTLKENSTYRMVGYYTENPNIIKFNLSDATEYITKI